MSLSKHFLSVVLAATLTSVALSNHVYAEEEFSISITGPDGETQAPRAARPARPVQAVRTATPAPATNVATNVATNQRPQNQGATAPATTPANQGTALAQGGAQGGMPGANGALGTTNQAGAQAPSGAATTHTVQPRETIWSIAHRYSAPYSDVNEFQAVASIYRNNRTAFEDNDVNRIRRGATINIPSHDAMALEQTRTGSDLLSRGITDLPPLPANARLAANQTGQTGAQGAANANATASASASAQVGAPSAPTGTAGQGQALAQNQGQGATSSSAAQASGQVKPTIPTFTARETMLRDANPVWVAPEGAYDDYTKEVLSDAQLAEQNANKTQEYVPEITRSTMDLQAIEQLLDKTERNIQTAQKDIYRRLDDNIQRSAQVARETATATAQEEVADLINHYEQVIAELQQSNNDLRANLSRINKQVEQIRGIQLETADNMAALDRRLGSDPLAGASGPSSSASFQSGPIMWVLLIIGAIAFLLSIGLFIFKSRMRRERAMASTYDDDDSGDFMDEEDIEISNLLAKANMAAEHDTTERKQESAPEQTQAPAAAPAPQPTPAPADDAFASGFDGSLGDFGADAPAPAPQPAPAPTARPTPDFHDDIEIPGFPSSKSAAPAVAPAPKAPSAGASLAAAAAGGALAGAAASAALAASPEDEAQSAWDSAATGAGTSSLEKSAANAAGDSWAQSLGDQEANASQVDLGGGFGSDAGGDFGGSDFGDAGADAGGFGDTGADAGGFGDTGADAGGFGDADGDFGSDAAGGDFGGGDFGGANDNGGFGDAGGDFGSANDAGSFGAADDGFGSGDLGAAGTDNGGFGAADDGFGADAGGDFGSASGDDASFGAADDGFGDAASGDNGGFGAADDGFGAGGDFGGDAGGFGEAASGDNGSFGAADDGFGAAGDFGGDAGGFGDAGGDFGGDAGGFGDAGGDFGGDAGGFGDDSGGFGDTGGDFGDTGGDFGGGFDDMDLGGDDAKQFAESMQNAGSANFPKTNALAPEVNETSANTDDHTTEAPAEVGAQHEFDDLVAPPEQAAELAAEQAEEATAEPAPEVQADGAQASAVAAAAGAALAAGALAAAAADKAEAQPKPAAPAEPVEHSEHDKAAATPELADLTPPETSAEPPVSDAALKQEEPALSSVFDNLVSGKRPDEILAETPEGVNLDSVYDRFFTEEGEVAPEVVEAAQEVNAHLEDKHGAAQTSSDHNSELVEGLYEPPAGLDQGLEHAEPQSDEEQSLAAAFGASKPEHSDADKAMAEAFGAASEPEHSDADKAMAEAFGAASEPELSDADKAMAEAFGGASEPELSDADKAMAEAFGAASEPELSDADKAMAEAFGASKPEHSDADKAMAEAFGAASEPEHSDADKAMAEAFGAASEPELSDADKAMAEAFGGASEPELSDADKAMAEAFGATSEPELSDADKAMAESFGGASEPELSDADKAMAESFGGASEPELSDADKAMADAFDAAEPSDLGAGITDLSGELDAGDDSADLGTPDLADTEFAGFNTDAGSEDELPSLDAGLKHLAAGSESAAASAPENEEASLAQALAQASAQRNDDAEPQLADGAADQVPTELESLQDTFNVPEDSAADIAREAVPQTAAQEAKDLADVLGTSLDSADLKEPEEHALDSGSDALMSADETFGSEADDLGSDLSSGLGADLGAELGAGLDSDLDAGTNFVDLSHEDNIIPGDNSVQGQDFKSFDLGGDDRAAATELKDAAADTNDATSGDLFGTDANDDLADDELFGQVDPKGDWDQGFDHYAEEPVDDSDDHDFVNFANNLHRKQEASAPEGTSDDAPVDSQVEDEFKGIHDYDSDRDLSLAAANDDLTVPDDSEITTSSTADDFDADGSNAVLDRIEQTAAPSSEPELELESGDLAELADVAPAEIEAEAEAESAPVGAASADGADFLSDIHDQSSELDATLGADQDLTGVSSYDAQNPFDDSADEENDLILPDVDELAPAEDSVALDDADLEPEAPVEAPAAELADSDAADAAESDAVDSDAVESGASSALDEVPAVDPAASAEEDLALPTQDIMDDVSAHTQDLDAEISADEDLKGLSSYDKDERYTQHTPDTELILPSDDDVAAASSLDDLDSADFQSALDNLAIPDEEQDFAAATAAEQAQAETDSESAVPDAAAVGVDVEPATEFETERAHEVEEPFLEVEDAKLAPDSAEAAVTMPQTPIDESGEVEDVSDSETELEPSMWSVPSDEDFDLPPVSGVNADDLAPEAPAEAVGAESERTEGPEGVAPADDADLSAAGFTTHELDDFESPESEAAVAPESEAGSDAWAEPEVNAEVNAEDAPSAEDLGADFAAAIDRDLDSGSANWPEPDLDVSDSDDELYTSHIGSADALADMLSDVPADIPADVVRQSGSHIAADTEPVNLDVSARPKLEAEPVAAAEVAADAEPAGDADAAALEQALAQAPSADSSGDAAQAIVGDMVSGAGDDELLGGDLGLDQAQAAAQSDELMGSMMAEPESESGAAWGDFDFGAEGNASGAESGAATGSDFDAFSDFDLGADGATAGADADADADADLGDFDFDALESDGSGSEDLGAFEGDFDFGSGDDAPVDEGDFSDLGAEGDDAAFAGLDDLDGLAGLDDFAPVDAAAAKDGSAPQAPNASR